MRQASVGLGQGPGNSGRLVRGQGGECRGHWLAQGYGYGFQQHRQAGSAGAVGPSGAWPGCAGHAGFFSFLLLSQGVPQPRFLPAFPSGGALKEAAASDENPALLVLALPSWTAL